MDRYLENLIYENKKAEGRLVDAYSEEIPEEDRDPEYYEALYDLAEKRQKEGFEIEM